jgi:hypothetical protein
VRVPEKVGERGLGHVNSMATGGLVVGPVSARISFNRHAKEVVEPRDANLVRSVVPLAVTNRRVSSRAYFSPLPSIRRSRSERQTAPDERDRYKDPGQLRGLVSETLVGRERARTPPPTSRVPAPCRCT